MGRKEGERKMGRWKRMWYPGKVLVCVAGKREKIFKND
jgi:hypothetical protein